MVEPCIDGWLSDIPTRLTHTRDVVESRKVTDEHGGRITVLIDPSDRCRASARTVFPTRIGAFCARRSEQWLMCEKLSATYRVGRDIPLTAGSDRPRSG